MEYRILGAALILLGCSGFGFSLAAGCKREERLLNQMYSLLLDMESELQYRLTPLPELCRRACSGLQGPMKRILNDFAGQLEQRMAPDPGSCMASAVRNEDLPYRKVRLLLLELGRSLGRFDVAGQLRGLEYIRKCCQDALEELRCRGKEHISCYKTIGICAGVSLAILFL